jgi:UDP-2,3-diacylglucosamine hydrolase
VSVTLFISDLHLCVSRPHSNKLFFRFLEREARGADALYILGDLCEYWVGDDDLSDPFNHSIAAALKSLARTGVPIFLMHGNRDFLIGPKFCSASGATLLDDPTIVELNGTRTLLMHGDTLCTDDVDYQRFRAQVRGEAWQREFLARPLTERKAMAEELRRKSELEKRRKSAAIMDVTPASVDALLRAEQTPLLIHGHTHRPARHSHTVDGKRFERWVLPDWYDSGGYLRCEPHDIALQRFDS